MAATTTAAKPRIRIRNATEADLPAISRIHYDAFGPGVMMRLMHPPQGQPTDAALAAFEKSLRSALPEQRPTTTTTTTAAALSTTAGQKKRELPVEFVLMVAERLLPGQDGGEGEVIAFAKWKVVKEELTEEEWNVDVKDQTVEELGVGTDVDVYNAFISELVRTAKGLQKGEPLLCEDCCCSLLCPSLPFSPILSFSSFPKKTTIPETGILKGSIPRLTKNKPFLHST